MKTFASFCAGIALLAATTPAAATSTRLTVHVLSHDAKLIGDLSGGIEVRVRNVEDDTILAQGVQWGGTGDTGLIIKSPHVRGEEIYGGAGSARYDCELDLTRPTWVRIETGTPRGFPNLSARASRTMLLLPGHHVEGDGVVLELHGLIVNLLSPGSEERLEPGSTAHVSVGVKLLCTCPIFEGSLWEADDYAVTLQLLSRDEVIEEIPLAFNGEPNVFEGDVRLPAVDAGEQRVIEFRALAANDATANYGTDAAVFRLRGATD